MNKNKFLYLTIVSFFLLLASCGKTESPKVKISGELKKFSNKTIQLTLEEDINRKKSQVIAEIPVDSEGRFKFEKDLVPHIYSLKISDKKSLMLAVDKGQNIVITGDVAEANSIKVSGSEDTAKLESYEKFRKESLDRLVISVRNQIKELKEKNTAENDPKLLELSQLEIENYNKHKDEMLEFVKKEMGVSLAIYPTSIRWDGEKHLPFLNDLVQKFEAKYPNLAITEKVIEKVKILSANSIGGTVAEISMPDKEGKTIPLSSVKAKIILIDFWGSWCAPCRRESGELSALYQKYQPKGFEIFGVGLESEKEVWHKAIEQDKRIWANVASFTEFETQAAFDYAVTSLPANFLIDENRKVIAKNLHGKELKDKLEELLSK